MVAVKWKRIRQIRLITTINNYNNSEKMSSLSSGTDIHTSLFHEAELRS